MPQLTGLQQAIFRQGRGKLAVFICLVVVFFSLTLSLGFWQLDRAAQKEDYLARNQTNEIMQASSWVSAIDGQLIQLNGKYLSQYQFLIDNKTYQGKFGYDVIVPFLTKVGLDDVLFWVNLGWVEASVDRSKLNKTNLPNAEVELQARVYLPAKKGFRLSDAQYQTQGWPSRVQYFDASFFQQLIGTELTQKKRHLLVSGFEMRLEAHQAGVQVRRWLPNNVMPPEKHLAYAFQWFALAFSLIVLAVVFLVRHVKESMNNEI
ncbi:hypothetical protein OA92_23615 [Marinomonas sp. SBI22]|uniref:SURF1 family protein n=1 Tax=unclassified Marinomonas TaxID=196814 RepID=UPI0007AF92C9|nr:MULTISPECIES: SURF1 family protein [unclassified Marinomonas]KZM38491.1 hypothetical protein OA92_23615 [Marinomonas sp. SBI22]KZM38679.1 hypothetical protein OA91_23615 [Marinomonas sp. SBI8L]